jgi:xanthine dehydrogenase YagS FAD-binding subunit
MRNFDHIDAGTIQEAAKLLEEDDTRIIAGGSNVLPLIKLGIAKPRRLINIKSIPTLNEISFDEEGGLKIGALVTIDSVAANKIVRERYKLLSEATYSIASPQIRNVATICGNLCQEPRCWYYRGPQECWLKGGRMCYAAAGENEHHAILGAGACNSVQPSDSAPALIALGAKAQINDSREERIIPVEEIFQKPVDGSRRLTSLRPGELITALEVPTPKKGNIGTYIKKMNRRIWTFASVSIAAQLTIENGVVGDAKLVLGGVSSIPWRLSQSEMELGGHPLDDETIERAVEASTTGARPLKHNAYKIPLARGVVMEALTKLRLQARW